MTIAAKQKLEEIARERLGEFVIERLLKTPMTPRHPSLKQHVKFMPGV